MTSHPPYTQNNLDLLREMEQEDVDFDALSIHLISMAQPLSHNKSAYMTPGEDSDTHSVQAGDEFHAHKSFPNLGSKILPQKQRISLAEDVDAQKSCNENTEEGLQRRKSFVLCKSPPQSLRRQNLELPPLDGRRRSARSTIRPSNVRSSHSAQPREDSNRKDSQEQAHNDNSASQMTLTEKRMAMVRNRFSSKNLFNVKRQNVASSFTEGYSGKSDNSSDASRKLNSGRPFSQQRSYSGGQGRPVTSFPAFQGRQFHPNGINRPSSRPTTTSSPKVSSLVNQPPPAVDAFFSRKPRSRRQLEKLSQKKIDPFRAAEMPAEEKSYDHWIPVGDVHHDRLQRLRRHGPSLQQRVTSFLKDLEDFNRRDHKTGLEHILEIR